jgi:hypothetical protein
MNTPTTMPRERLRLKITLEHFRPAIWRRVEVDDDLSFQELHRVIQDGHGLARMPTCTNSASPACG